MNYAGFVVMTVLAASPAASITQKATPPNFTGDWVLDSARSSTGATQTGLRGRGGPPPGPAATGGSGPVRVGGDVREPHKTKDVRPLYPRDAIFAKIGGTVVLETVIGKNGRVASVRVIRSLPGLDEAAMDAVSQWEYEPTLVNGAAVEVLMTVTVGFEMTPPGSAPSTPVFGGRGAVGAQTFTIKQDDKTLKMTRAMPNGSAAITYRLDGKASKNRLVATSADGDLMFVYVSRWDGDTLVTLITSPAGQAASQRKETIALDGDALVVRWIRIDPATGTESIVQTCVYTRRQ